MEEQATTAEPSIWECIAAFFSIEPGPYWLWGTIILSIIAFGLAILAMPTVLQMFCGRPKISIKLKTAHTTAHKVLQFWVENEPIKSKFLKFVKVTRDPAYVVCSLCIYEEGTGKVIFEHTKAKINVEQGEPTLQALVTPSFPGIGVAVYMNLQTKETFFRHDDEWLPIEKGHYKIEILVTSAGEGVAEVTGKAYIGPNVERFFWGNGDE
jgi:hypothetical protein